MRRADAPAWFRRNTDGCRDKARWYDGILRFAPPEHSRDMHHFGVDFAEAKRLKRLSEEEQEALISGTAGEGVRLASLN